MKNKKLYLTLVVLILTTLACSLFGGGGDAGSESEVSPDEAQPAGSEKYDTEFPMPPDVDNFMDMGDSGINYQTSMTIDEAVDFYRTEFKKAGYDERDITTVVSDEVFSIVWDGHSSGMAIVAQGTPLGDGVLNVNIRFEDV